MEGAAELAEEIFHMPVRVGYPQSIEGLADIVRNPVYSTAVGLLLYGANHAGEAHTGRGSSTEGAWWSRMTNWVRESF